MSESKTQTEDYRINERGWGADFVKEHNVPRRQQSIENKRSVSIRNGLSVHVFSIDRNKIASCKFTADFRNMGTSTVEEVNRGFSQVSPLVVLL